MKEIEVKNIEMSSEEIDKVIRILSEIPYKYSSSLIQFRVISKFKKTIK